MSSAIPLQLVDSLAHTSLVLGLGVLLCLLQLLFYLLFKDASPLDEKVFCLYSAQLEFNVTCSGQRLSAG